MNQLAAIATIVGTLVALIGSFVSRGTEGFRIPVPNLVNFGTLESRALFLFTLFFTVGPILSWGPLMGVPLGIANLMLIPVLPEWLVQDVEEGSPEMVRFVLSFIVVLALAIADIATVVHLFYPDSFIQRQFRS